MKLKLSKKTGLVIGLGVFVIAAGVLGMISSQKLNEKSTLEKQLTTSQTRLQGIKVPTSSQPANLQNQLDQLSSNLTQVTANLSEPVSSTNATAAIFDVAKAFGLAVTVTTSSSTSNETFENGQFVPIGDGAGVPLSALSVTATVQGNLSSIIDFVKALNYPFKTSAITSVEMTVPVIINADNTTAPNGDNTTSIIKLVVYTYRGE